MIRYDLPAAGLAAEIEAERKGWLKRAERRTKKFIDARKYHEKSGIWSEIKAVYSRMQNNKCAYCERQLASLDFGGAIEHDLEHFRPKGDVPPWPSPAIAAERNLKYSFSTGDALPAGYYWLAYHPENYCVGCKKCNSPLKTNYFPIAGRRGAVAGDPALLDGVEQPLLIYPLGNRDENPAELITFVGINAVPRARRGVQRHRAQVTIDFFELNRREELIRERAEDLVALDNALAVIETSSDPARRTTAENDIIRMRASAHRHSACILAACDLYQSKPLKARELFSAARSYLDSLGG